jgi:hypothetical protein
MLGVIGLGAWQVSDGVAMSCPVLRVPAHNSLAFAPAIVLQEEILDRLIWRYASMHMLHD